MTWTWLCRVMGLPLVLWCLGCGGGGGSTGLPADTGGDGPVPADAWADGEDSILFADTPAPEAGSDAPGMDLDGGDAELPAGCGPGEGCFLSPCSGNGECLSGWCVEHMGQQVCTQTCQEECPDGWSCTQVGGTEPDVVFICVSDYPSLCRPCTAAADCTGIGGTEDPCVAYGDKTGAFCGGLCGEGGTCPQGFSCQNATTVAGVELEQCVSDLGTCPCTDTSVALGLFTYCQVGNRHGTCQGQRVCLAEGLSDCDAAEPAEETCNGLDDDCDAAVDEGDMVEVVPICDDGNGCTADACLGAAGCEHTPLSTGECIDGDPCTVADHCVEGACVGNTVICNDGNPCTDDSCDSGGGCLFVPNTASCNDGDPCTVEDQCQDTACAGTPVACDCQTDADCAALEDGDLCNGTLACNFGVWPYKCAIVPGTVQVCPGPFPGPDAVCQQAFCDPPTGQCAVIAGNEGGACNDGILCTTGDHCASGECVPGALGPCDDGNPCTADVCDAGQGCVSTPADGPCDDLNTCTIGDHCAGGECGHDGALYCEDFNPCTDEACDPLLGCIHTVNTAPCEDEDACTVGDTCAGGECLGGPPPDCDDQDPCTAESCDAVLGCQYQNACVGWHVVALVPAAVTAQPLASGTLTLTVGQPGAGPKQGPQLSIHVGLGPITTVE